MRKMLFLCLLYTILLAACSEAIDNSSSRAPFELTEEEQTVYEQLQKDLSEQHIINLSPISIAKIYVQAGFDEKYDVQYALYTDRADYILWTKEEDLDIAQSHKPTSEQLTETYANLDKGTFIQRSDIEGYIEYISGNKSSGKSGFQMIRDEDGIWNVAFMPIQ